jgi:hypothetical protein
MYGQYELKSLVDQRHEEALQEAQTRRLATQARANRPSRFGLGGVGSALSGALSVLKGCNCPSD